jgi:hypothetical protein
MKYLKWYLVNGEKINGHHAIIKEELTDIIVAEFPVVSRQEANERNINLTTLVNEHNKLVKALLN